MKALTTEGLTYLAQLPRNRYFQLFIDGKMHRQGVQTFEGREPGCMNAYYRALAYAISHIDEPLSVEWLHEIHKRASTGVSGYFNNVDPGQFRNSPMCQFTVDLNRLTVSGVMSLRENPRYQFLFSDDENSAALTCVVGDQKRFDPIHDNEFYVFDNLMDNITLDITAIYEPPFKNDQKVIETANMLIERYNREIGAAKNEDEVLSVIVLCVRSFELLHSYGDGNGRVLVNVMLNVLLMKHGFPPATFYEPNIFDLYDEDELVYAVKEAMQHTLFCIDQPKESLYGYIPNEKDMISDESYKRISRNIADDKTSHFKKHNLKIRKYLESSLDATLKLHRACVFGDIKTIRRLLNRRNLTRCAPLGAPPLSRGLAPLHIACKMGRANVVKTILDYMPVLAKQKDSYGKIALFYAIEQGHNDIANQWIDAGFSVGETVKDKRALLECAARHGSVEVFKKLLPPDYLAFKQILYCAAEENNLPVVKWLVDTHKVDLQKEVEKEGFLIFINDAVVNRSYDVANYLISQTYRDKKADLKDAIECYCRVSPEIYKSKETFNVLLSGCDLTEKLSASDIPLDVWIDVITQSHLKDDSNSLRMMSLVSDLSAYQDIGALLTAAYDVRRVDLVKYMITEIGCDPNAYDNEFEDTIYNLLHLAALRNDVEMIRFLINTNRIELDKVTVNRPTANNMGLFAKSVTAQPVYSALDLAVKEGSLQAVEVLISSGAKLTDTTEKCLASCTKNTTEIKVLMTKLLDQRPDASLQH